MPAPFSNTQLRTISLGELNAGLLSDLNPFDVPMGAASSCNNYVWVDGYLRPRQGLSTYDGPGFGYSSVAYPVGHNIALVAPYTYLDSVSNELVRSLMRIDIDPTNGNLWLYQLVPGGSWTLVAGPLPGYVSPLTGLPLPNVYPTSANWKNSFWFTSGLTVYQYTNGAGAVVDVNAVQTNPALKLPNNPRIMIAGDSRLFIADCSTMSDGTGVRSPYRVAWSDFLNGTVWNSGLNAGTSGYVDLPNEQSERITGLYYAGSVLMVFQPSVLYLGVSAGPPMVFDFRQRVTGVGCISHRTIRRYRDGWVIWLGDDNVYRGGTDRNPEAIGDHIRPRLRQLASLSDIANARATLDRDNHLYTLYLPSAVGGESGRVCRTLTANLRNGSWWEGQLVYPGADVADATEFRESPWTSRQLVADRAGKIYSQSFDFTKDDATDIPASWTSGIISVPTVLQGVTDQASLQQVRIYAASGLVDIGVWAGDDIDRLVHYDFGTQTCDGTSSVLVSERPPMGENFQVTLTNTEVNDAAKISKIAVGAILGGPTRR